MDGWEVFSNTGYTMYEAFNDGSENCLVHLQIINGIAYLFIWDPLSFLSPE